MPLSLRFDVHLLSRSHHWPSSTKLSRTMDQIVSPTYLRHELDVTLCDSERCAQQPITNANSEGTIFKALRSQFKRGKYLDDRTVQRWPSELYRNVYNYEEERVGAVIPGRGRDRACCRQPIREKRAPKRRLQTDS